MVDDLFNCASNYVQGPIQSNLHVLSSYDTSNMHHMYHDSYASATPQIHMSMNNMMGLVNQFETPHVKISNSIEESVSPFYSSATNFAVCESNLADGWENWPCYY